MHPEVNEPSPGPCPFCGMDLESKEPGGEEEHALKCMVWRFVIAIAFTIPVIVLDAINGHYAIAQAVLCTPVVLGAGSFFFSRGFITRSANMFTLIGLGVGTAYFYSIIVTFFPYIFPPSFREEHGVIALYFEAAAVVTVLVLIGQVLEARARIKTGSAIRALLNLTPKEASLLLENGEEKRVPIEHIQVGDRVRVRPGERVAVDGILLDGESTVDESMITGESMPIVKRLGDKVMGGTINGTGAFSMRADRVGEDTLLAHIVHMVNEAQRSRAPIQRLADRVAAVFVPIVLGVALLTVLFWGFLGPQPSWPYGIINAVAVLIIACPCALGLATPVSITVGIGKGTHFGVLIKNADALERMAQIRAIAIDKTGTLTEGKIHLNQIYAIAEKEERLLSLAASLEVHSEHPIGAAIVAHAHERGVPLCDVEEFQSHTGFGLSGRVEQHEIAIGNQKHMQALGVPLEPFAEQAEAFRQEGQTVLHLAIDRRPAGLFALSDVVKVGALEAIAALHKEGMRIIMLTGDNPMTARAIGKQLGIDEIQAEILPQDKIRIVKEHQERGDPMAMAGDGINDAPALAQADVGIAMGTGTDVAMESAGIILIKGDLQGIERARKLSIATVRNIKQNLVFAFMYNTVAIPVAAGVFYPHFHFMLNPIISSAAMSLSSLTVIWNALRLRWVRL